MREKKNEIKFSFMKKINIFNRNKFKMYSPHIPISMNLHSVVWRIVKRVFKLQKAKIIRWDVWNKFILLASVSNFFQARIDPFW